jgi:outer membrane protein
MTSTKLLFTAIISLVASGVMAQTDTTNTYSFNLQECIDYALKNQTAVLNAEIDTKIADAKVRETIGIGLPQVSGTADFSDYLKSPVVLFPDFIGPAIYGAIEDNVRDANGNPLTVNRPAGVGGFQEVNFQQKYNSNLGLSVNQLIFSGSYIVGLQASKTYKELSQRNYTRNRIETNVAVTKAYYLVLVNDEQINLLNANITQLEVQLKQTTALNQNGFAEKIDVDRLTVLYNNLITERENIRRSLALGNQMLKFQMGMPVEKKLIVEGKIADVNFDAQPVVTDTVAYRNRIEYGLAETQVKLNELDLRRYKSEYLPTLAAFGSTSMQFQNNSFKELYRNTYPATLIGLQLNVPIFSGFQKANRVTQAKLAVQKSTNDLFNAKNSINLDIQNSATTYTNSLSSLNNQKRNMDLANEVLRVSKIKYEEGVGSSIEVTQAQTSLKEAENNYINALYEALTYKVNLEKSLGRIN